MQIRIHDGFGSTIGTFDTDDLERAGGNLYFSFEATNQDGTAYEGDFSLWFQDDEHTVTLGHYDSDTDDWETSPRIDLINPNNF